MSEFESHPALFLGIACYIRSNEIHYEANPDDHCCGDVGVLRGEQAEERVDQRAGVQEARARREARNDNNVQLLMESLVIVLVILFCLFWEIQMEDQGM